MKIRLLVLTSVALAPIDPVSAMQAGGLRPVVALNDGPSWRASQQRLLTW